jgi:hypothetical protein
MLEFPADSLLFRIFYWLKNSDSFTERTCTKHGERKEISRDSRPTTLSSCKLMTFTSYLLIGLSLSYLRIENEVGLGTVKKYYTSIDCESRLMK